MDWYSFFLRPIIVSYVQILTRIIPMFACYVVGRFLKDLCWLCHPVALCIRRPCTIVSSAYVLPQSAFFFWKAVHPPLLAATQIPHSCWLSDIYIHVYTYVWQITIIPKPQKKTCCGWFFLVSLIYSDLVVRSLYFIWTLYIYVIIYVPHTDRQIWYAWVYRHMG